MKVLVLNKILTFLTSIFIMFGAIHLSEEGDNVIVQSLTGYDVLYFLTIFTILIVSVIWLEWVG